MFDRSDEKKDGMGGYFPSIILTNNPGISFALNGGCNDHI